MNLYRFTKMAHAVLFYGLLTSISIKTADELTYVTGAPVGAFSEGEPVYQQDYSSSVDWFSGEIDGNYYLAALAPDTSDIGSEIQKTIAVYQFVPGDPTENGNLVFIDSAPTGQSPIGSGTGGLDDDAFSIPISVSWFPGSINGSYYFTVGGKPNGNEVRLYQFTPAVPTTNGTITFIDSAPVPGEVGISEAYSVDWFPTDIDGIHYFSVSSGGATPEVRVYSFDQASQTLSWDGAAAIDFVTCDGELLNNHAHIAWAPGLLNGEAFLAVGDDQKIRIYRFCPDRCGSGTGGSEVCPFFKPQSLHMELVTTSSTLPPGNLNQPWGIRWLKVGQETYVIAGCESGKAKLFQFFQDSNDPTAGIVEYITEVPTNGVSCNGETDGNTFNTVTSVDWLTFDGAYYLVIGGVFGEEGQLIRVYRFDPRRKRFTFLAGAAPILNEPLPFAFLFSIDWFPKKIMGEFYFAAGVAREIGPIGSVLGSDDTGLVRIYSFDPLCPNSLLSWRNSCAQRDLKK